MRPRFVAAILLVAILAVAAMIFFKPRSATRSPQIAPIAAVKTATQSALPPLPPPSQEVIVKKPMTPEEKQETIEVEKDRLYTWSMNSDPQSYSNILADLSSPEKEIRMAAIDAVKEFGDTNAIPVLKSLAANTEDTQEAVAMLEAAEFLSLPPLDFNEPTTPKTPEEIQAAAQRRQQRMEANQQKHSHQNPNAPSSPDSQAQNPQ